MPQGEGLEGDLEVVQEVVLEVVPVEQRNLEESRMVVH